MTRYNVTSHYVPRLEEYGAFLEAIEGGADATLRELHDRIEERTGTPQEPKDWSEPAKWVAEFHEQGVFDDATHSLACKLHAAGLNPRHWRLDAVRTARKDGTLDVDAAGRYRLTEFGRSLSAGEAEAADRYLTANGMYAILGFLRDENGQTLDGLAEPWRQWLHAAAHRNVKSRLVLRDGLWSRLTHVLMPLGYAKSEGVPRRYFLTPKGGDKATDLKIEEAGPPAQKEKRAHEIAVDDIIKVGDLLGYRTARTPTLRDLLPRAEQQNAVASVYSKQIDACWSAELPLLGEIRVAIEVQDKGSVSDLVSRLKVIAPFCHYLIIISDEAQIQSMQEFMVATGDEKTFKAKTVWITPGQLHEVRQEVGHLSSVLTPSEQGASEEAEEMEGQGEESDEE